MLFYQEVLGREWQHDGPISFIQEREQKTEIDSHLQDDE